jgi:hypothetical protein
VNLLETIQQLDVPGLRLVVHLTPEAFDELIEQLARFGCNPYWHPLMISTGCGEVRINRDAVFAHRLNGEPENLYEDRDIDAALGAFEEAASP